MRNLSINMVLSANKSISLEAWFVFDSLLNSLDIGYVKNKYCWDWHIVQLWFFINDAAESRTVKKNEVRKSNVVTFYKLPMKTIVFPQISRSTINSREQQWWCWICHNHIMTTMHGGVWSVLPIRKHCSILLRCDTF